MIPCFRPRWVQSMLHFLWGFVPDHAQNASAKCTKIIATTSFWSRRPISHTAGQAATFVHKTLPQQQSVFSWTKLISEHAKSGQGREALRIYRHMQKEGITPETYTFVAVLKACSSVADLEAGKEIHAHAIENGNHGNIFVASALVDMYAKCGSMVDARQVFEKMPYRNLVSWNAMIMGYAKEVGETALQLYARMQNEGFRPDARTFVAALKACGNLAAQEQGKQVDGELLKIECLEKGRAIHSQVVKSGLQWDIFVASTLIDTYAKCGSMADAHRVFEAMPRRNLVSWTAMIMGYTQMEKGELALQFYTRLQQEGLTPDAQLFVAALKACSSLAKQEEGKQVDGELLKISCLQKGKIIHSQVTKSGFEADIIVENTLVDMYAKCGSMVDAGRIFEKMLHRNVVSWNAMIMGYAQMEKGELALQLYARMRHEGFIPDAYTFVAALMACSTLSSLETGKGIHAEIFRAGLDDDAFVTTCLVDMYGKCGNMEDAQLLFDTSPARDVVRWSALIAGYSGQGDSECVFNLFERMQQEGFQPVGITFVSILNVCSHAGLVSKGQHYFQTMCAAYGITPESTHYTCMVNLLGRAGQLDEAVAMVKKMPFKPDMVTWMTILSACQRWSNMEVGRHAFDCVVQLDKKQAAAYVLMTSIYASEGGEC